MTERWLPKDERRLLAGYFTQIGDIGTEAVFPVSSLCDWLTPRWLAWLTFRGHRKRIAEYGDPEKPPSGRADPNGIRAYINSSNRVRIANKLLAERRFIILDPHESVVDVFVVGLTLEGFDLGRRYSNFFDFSGLLFQEHKDHWVWLIAAFIGGSLGAKLLGLIASRFG